jgi:hypothetical protein
MQDVADQFVSQFGLGVIGTDKMRRDTAPILLGMSDMARSPLGRTIAHVVSFSPQKQMGRIDADRIVASVQHANFSGYRAVVDFVRNAVSKALAVPPVDLLLKHAVSLVVFDGEPQPALVWSSLIDLRPKASFDWSCGFNHSKTVWENAQSVKVGV